MIDFRPFSLNIRSELLEFERPLVMGIVNVTDDSFYGLSRIKSVDALRSRVESMIGAGVDIIDIGACSTRPGADVVGEDVEADRIASGVKIIREISENIMVSVDTFRSDVARIAIAECGADIVNDISGGTLDADMWNTVARLHCPYVLMHMRGTPATMQSLTTYENVTVDVIKELSVKLRELRLMGVGDVIVDPGFGFAKTIEQNFEMMRNLDSFSRLLDAPVLVGISRKSMITRPLALKPEEALAGTIALNTIALAKGASILRVHDVAECMAAVRMHSLTFSN